MLPNFLWAAVTICTFLIPSLAQQIDEGLVARDVLLCPVVCATVQECPVYISQYIAKPTTLTLSGGLEVQISIAPTVFVTIVTVTETISNLTLVPTLPGGGSIGGTTTNIGSSNGGTITNIGSSNSATVSSAINTVPDQALPPAGITDTDLFRLQVVQSEVVIVPRQAIDYIDAVAAITNDIDGAALYYIKDGHLFLYESQIEFSTLPGIPFSPFKADSSLGSIFEIFSIVETLLSWVNPNFANDTAIFCVVDNIVQAVFLSKPNGCLDIQLRVDLVGATSSTLGATSSILGRTSSILGRTSSILGATSSTLAVSPPISSSTLGVSPSISSLPPPASSTPDPPDTTSSPFTPGGPWLNTTRASSGASSRSSIPTLPISSVSSTSVLSSSDTRISTSSTSSSAVSTNLGSSSESSSTSSVSGSSSSSSSHSSSSTINTPSGTTSSSSTISELTSVLSSSSESSISSSSSEFSSMSSISSESSSVSSESSGISESSSTIPEPSSTISESISSVSESSSSASASASGPAPILSPDGTCGAEFNYVCDDGTNTYTSDNGIASPCCNSGICLWDSESCTNGCNSDYGKCGSDPPSGPGISPDGTCGGTDGYVCFTETNVYIDPFSQPMPCCSSEGQCSSSEVGCNPNSCQADFGHCGISPDNTCGTDSGFVCSDGDNIAEGGACCAESNTCAGDDGSCSIDNGCQEGFGTCAGAQVISTDGQCGILPNGAFWCMLEDGTTYNDGSDDVACCTNNNCGTGEDFCTQNLGCDPYFGLCWDEA